MKVELCMSERESRPKRIIYIMWTHHQRGLYEPDVSAIVATAAALDKPSLMCIINMYRAPLLFSFCYCRL